MKTFLLLILVATTSAFAQAEIDLGTAYLTNRKNANFEFEISPDTAGKLKLKYKLVSKRSSCASIYVNQYSGQLGCLHRTWETVERDKTVLVDIRKSSTKVNHSSQKLKLKVQRVGSEGLWVNHSLEIIDGQKDEIKEKHRFAVIGTKFVLKSSSTREQDIVQASLGKEELPEFVGESIENHLNSVEQ